MTRSLARLKLIAAVALIQTASMLAMAAPITATPGSLSSFQYFPPVATTPSGGGGGGEASGEVATLQRCVWTPKTADANLVVKDEFSYGKPIAITYRMVGGNGGGTHNGGGGGSSAIIKNGAVVAIGNGGDGGSAAAAVTGEFEAKAGDTIRLITGGGGGAGVWGGTYSIGGGGGAGYTGGGGGASHNGGAPTPNADHRGRGGSAAPGTGGFGVGMLAGSNASGTNGGVATYPDGSTATIGSPTPHFHYRVSTHTSYPVALVSRYPATPSTMGSQVASYSFGTSAAWTGGGGGAWGMGGNAAAYVDMRGHYDGDRGEMTSLNNKPYMSFSKGVHYMVGSNIYGPAYMNYQIIYGSNVAEYDPPTEDLNFTRAIKPNTNSPSLLPTYYTDGSLGGQIILMYQAPVCTFL